MNKRIYHADSSTFYRPTRHFNLSAFVCLFVFEIFDETASAKNFIFLAVARKVISVLLIAFTISHSLTLSWEILVKISLHLETLL